MMPVLILVLIFHLDGGVDRVIVQASDCNQGAMEAQAKVATSPLFQPGDKLKMVCNPRGKDE